MSLAGTLGRIAFDDTEQALRVDRTNRGVNLILSPDNNYTDRMLLRGEEDEAEEQDAIGTLIEGKRTLFVDVGANSGVYTLLALKLAGKGSRVISFEPNPVVRARLEQNIAANSFAIAPEVRSVALGREPGLATLTSRPMRVRQRCSKARVPRRLMPRSGGCRTRCRHFPVTTSPF